MTTPVVLELPPVLSDDDAPPVLPDELELEEDEDEDEDELVEEDELEEDEPDESLDEDEPVSSDELPEDEDAVGLVSVVEVVSLVGVVVAAVLVPVDAVLLWVVTGSGEPVVSEDSELPPLESPPCATSPGHPAATKQNKIPDLLLINAGTVPPRN